jgi:WD40 repeat protein
LAGYEHPIAISPNGRIIAVATEHYLSVVDWKQKRVLWETDALEHEGYYYGKHLAIGDDGKTLFAAGAHTVERWDLSSGEHHALLIENEISMNGVVRFLKVSRSGKVLIAGFGLLGNQRPRSFAVWEVGKNEPALKFEEKEGANADISPDGDWIALSRFGTTNLILLKWRTGEKREVSLQISNDIWSVLWSPDGKLLAAYVDSWPASIIIYETANWKPIARWKCGKAGIDSEFFFGSDEILYQIRGNELNAFDISQPNVIGNDY